MKYLKGITLVVLLLFVSAAFVPSIAAERDSLKVIMLSEDAGYKVGANITIEVHVYHAGELITADDIEVVVQTHWRGDEHLVFVEEVSTGRYQGEYQIQDDDQYLWFSTLAEFGSDDDSSEMWVEIHEERLELNIHFSHQSRAYLWPGESVTATLTSKFRNEPVDVDEFTFLHLAGPEDSEVDLEYVRISEGVYETEVIIEEDTENQEYEIDAHAVYANAHSEASAPIIVNVLTVWYKLEEVAGSTATFVLGVADPLGKSVPNAEVRITYPQEEKKFTDEDGLTLFSLTNVHNRVTVSGYVVAGEFRQSFSGHIYIEDPEEQEARAHNRFDVL